MTNNHPITPPPELVNQWLTEGHNQDYCSATEHAIAQAARWGADQELEACCEWLETGPYGSSFEATAPSLTKRLRSARRPKPPTLKETLLARVARIPGEGADTAYLHHWLENESQRLVDALHKAIKSLPD